MTVSLKPAKPAKSTKPAKRTGVETKIIGANLRGVRKSKGLSQSEVGEVLQISFQQIQKYEKGTNRIPAEKLHRLKLYFNVPYAWFFKGI